jgi:trehalose 6-phosphate phosphatase
LTPDEARRRIAADPAGTALLFDFDGTLSAIVEDPSEATPIPGVVALLEDLEGRFGRVAVVSGRPRSFLTEHFGHRIDLSGLYGLETRIGGEEAEHPDASSWRPAVEEAVRSAAASLPSTVTVEHKGLSLTVHFRRDPADEDTVLSWARRAAGHTGLDLRAAKASVELHPALDVDKGTSVAALAEGCTAVVYVGDDLGDLPAFAALDGMRRRGTEVVKVATGSAELPAEVAAAADLVVDGPEGVIRLFRPLV